MRDRKRVLPGLLAACLGALNLIPALTLAAEPTVRQLIDLAPNIRSTDRTIQSIELAGYDCFEGKIDQTFRAIYRNPYKYAFLVSDAVTSVPIMFAANHDALFFEPVRPAVLYFSGTAVYRVINAENGRIRTTITTKFSGDYQNLLVFDIKSLYTEPAEDGAAPEVKVVKTGEKQYTLIRKFDKNYVRSHVDLTLSCPFARVEFARSLEGSPDRVIDRIIINGPLDDAQFAFPSRERLAGKIPTQEFTHDTLSLLDGGARVSRSFYAHSHVHEDTLERGLISPLLMGVRWSRVKENDAKYGPLLRDLIPGTTIPHQYVPSQYKNDSNEIRRAAFEAVEHRLPRVHLPIKFQLRFSKED